jgi:hypothetical protein
LQFGQGVAVGRLAVVPLLDRNVPRVGQSVEALVVVSGVDHQRLESRQLGLRGGEQFLVLLVNPLLGLHLDLRRVDRLLRLGPLGLRAFE